MRRLFPTSILLLPLILLLTPACQAQQVGEVIMLVGQADVTREPGTTKALATGDPIYVQDKLRTAQQSELVIRMVDRSRLSLGENTVLEVSQYRTEGEPEALITVTRGRLGAIVSDFFSSRSESFKVRTPPAVAGIRGTELVVIVRPENTQMTVLQGEGVVYSTDPAIPTKVILRARQSTTIREGHSPMPATSINGRDIEEIGVSNQGAGNGR
jgi:hypothetical protein